MKITTTRCNGSLRFRLVCTYKLCKEIIFDRCTMNIMSSLTSFFFFFFLLHLYNYYFVSEVSVLKGTLNSISCTVFKLFLKPVCVWNYHHLFYNCWFLYFNKKNLQILTTLSIALVYILPETEKVAELDNIRKAENWGLLGIRPIIQALLCTGVVPMSKIFIYLHQWNTRLLLTFPIF